MDFILATRVTINVASLIKEINKYDAKSLRRSTYQATKRIGFLVAKSDKKGLPLGMQIIANHFDEKSMFDVALSLEKSVKI